MLMRRLWPALLSVAIFGGCESSAPAGTVTPAAPGTTPSESAAPTAAAAPTATPCSRPTPSLVPPLVFQNGNLDLNAPYRLGFVQFFLVPCRDIATIQSGYGLGPSTLVITEPPNSNSDPDDIRSRYYRASVPVGQEAAFVMRLAAHPEDFQYVEFFLVSRACAIRGSPVEPICVMNSTVEPKEGPAGTSFKMRICCFDPGTAVTKTFTLRSGRTIVIPDRAGQDGTVPGGWGGSADDERGLYTLTVTSDKIGSIVRFRIN
jgi:hypothetical protein